MDGCAVEKRAAAPPGGEQLSFIGVQNNAVFHNAVLRQTHGNGALAKTADKVGGAVDGIDDKGPAGIGIGVFPLLLAVEDGAGKQRRKAFFQKVFHGQVVLRDQVRSRRFFMGPGGNVVGGENNPAGFFYNCNDLIQHGAFLLSYISHGMVNSVHHFTTFIDYLQVPT